VPAFQVGVSLSAQPLRYAELSWQLKAPFLRRGPFDPSLTLTRRIPGTERKRRNRMKDAKGSTGLVFRAFASRRLVGSARRIDDELGGKSHAA
jgi:hypothetical protein